MKLSFQPQIKSESKSEPCIDPTSEDSSRLFQSLENSKQEALNPGSLKSYSNRMIFFPNGNIKKIKSSQDFQTSSGKISPVQIDHQKKSEILILKNFPRYLKQIEIPQTVKISSHKIDIGGELKQKYKNPIYKNFLFNKKLSGQTMPNKKPNVPAKSMNLYENASIYKKKIENSTPRTKVVTITFQINKF